MPITVNSIKEYSFSKDRSEVILTFTGKYITEHDLIIPIDTLNDFVDALTHVRDQSREQFGFESTKPQKSTEKPESSKGQTQAASSEESVSVMKPKSWTVATDREKSDMVVVIFDYQMPTQAGFGLDPKGAKELSEDITKHASALLNVTV